MKLKMKNAEPVRCLATRIPKSLHRRVKFHCAKEDVLVAAFVQAAIQAKLHKKVSQFRQRMDARNAFRRWVGSGPARRRKSHGSRRPAP